MVSVLPHDLKISTGILVAIILLSILILLGCSTLAICYFRKRTCFHQNAGITSTVQLSLKNRRKACDDIYSYIVDVEENALSDHLHPRTSETLPPSVPLNCTENEIIRPAKHDAQNERYYFDGEVPEQPYINVVADNASKHSPIDLPKTLSENGGLSK